ncbi:TetR family transcriptional regulator [Mycobacterium sp. ACS4331]|uniref:TetR family transcriptional regulator n=1 Tax=Mycobacterium sp. ACS4331 TaxID=1834121 RepID=UPI0007FC3D80|nr:TetR family transcriptional regulator [Mycobacterium sp. ACS4331]OBF25224.1 TetR family transcriptional regulator [Mycobacterium sp. ACS4331]
MARWEPDAKGRLEQAALDLYLERGFDQTTVAEIAERAGLTERTFFRHFADKREVLFRGTELADAIAAALDEVPESVPPLDAVANALEAIADFFDSRRAYSAVRQKVIAANPALRERELIKLAAMADTLADALRRRGVAEPAASLTAQTGIAVFRIAFERWLADPAARSIAVHIRESLSELRSVAAQ